MIEIYIKERKNMDGPGIEKLEYEALSIKWLIEYQDIFIEKTDNQKSNEDIYYLEQVDFFRLLKKVRNMERRVKLNLKMNVSEHEFEDIKEISDFRKYLMELAIRTDFNWEEYILMAKIEAISFIDLEDAEFDYFY